MSLQNEALMNIIRSRLTGDSRIAALMIDIGCAEGFVVLRGVVDSEEQRDIVVRLVTGLIGVRNVIDQLKVRTARPAAVTADDWILV